MIDDAVDEEPKDVGQGEDAGQAQSHKSSKTPDGPGLKLSEDKDAGSKPQAGLSQAQLASCRGGNVKGAASSQDGNSTGGKSGNRSAGSILPMKSSRKRDTSASRGQEIFINEAYLKKNGMSQDQIFTGVYENIAEKLSTIPGDGREDEHGWQYPV